MGDEGNFHRVNKGVNVGKTKLLWEYKTNVGTDDKVAGWSFNFASELCNI